MNKLGVIIVDTDNYNLANNALINTLQRTKIDHVLVFTDNPLIWNEYDKKLIPKIISIEDYNEIILNEVANHIYLNHYLVIQYDGFVINEDNFQTEFLRYDYIGAHWPQYENRNVGNGGFSLRSKKLIESAANLSTKRKKNEAEDIFICRTIGSILEKNYDVSFACKKIASQFSFESPYTSRDTYGFHGFLNLPIIYKNNLDYLFRNLGKEILTKRKNEIIYGLTQCEGYNLENFIKEWII